MRQGEEGDKLFFIDRGIVDIFINKYDFVNKQNEDNDQKKDAPRSKAEADINLTSQA